MVIYCVFIQVKYLTLPGWNTNISGIRHFDKLPLNARKFVYTITELLEVPGNLRFF